MQRNFVVLALAIALLSSCADLKEKFGRTKQGHTQVSFNSHRSGEVSPSTLTGGMMLYVVGDTDAKYRRAIKFTDETAVAGQALTLPNGSYSFYALGFNGANMTSALRCAKANATLAGTATTVALNLSAAGCDVADFRPSSTFADATTGVKSLQLVSCDSGVGNAALEAFTGSSSCSATKGTLNHTRSVKIFLPTFQITSDLAQSADVSTAGGLSSACIQGDGSPGYTEAYSTSGNSVTAVASVGTTGVVFGNGSGGIKYSNDSGGTWNTGGSISPLTSADAFHVAGTRIFLAGSNGMSFSDNLGSTWSNTYYASSTYWNAITANAAGTTVWAGKSTGDIARSIDSGASFTPSVSTVGSLVTALYYDDIDGKLYAGTTGNGTVRISADNGDTWGNFATVNTDTEIHSIKRHGNYIYVGSYQRLTIFNTAGVSQGEFQTAAGAGMVKDIKFNNGSIYLASTDGGSRIYFNKISELATGWASYHALAGNQIYAMAFSGGKLFAADNGGSGMASVSDGKGSGVAFPGAPTLMVPAGSTSITWPMPVVLKQYSDPECTTESGSAFFPRGFGAATAAGNGAVLRDSSYLRLFLRD